MYQYFSQPLASVRLPMRIGTILFIYKAINPFNNFKCNKAEILTLEYLVLVLYSCWSYGFIYLLTLS